MVEPHSYNFRMITINVLGVRIFRKFRVYVNKKGADEPAHPCNLISTFLAHCLDSLIPMVSISEIPSLASVCSWAGWFESHLDAQLWRLVFLMTRLIFWYDTKSLLLVEALHRSFITTIAATYVFRWQLSESDVKSHLVDGNLKCHP